MDRARRLLFVIPANPAVSTEVYIKKKTKLWSFYRSPHVSTLFPPVPKQKQKKETFCLVSEQNKCITKTPALLCLWSNAQHLFWLHLHFPSWISFLSTVYALSHPSTGTYFPCSRPCMRQMKLYYDEENKLISNNHNLRNSQFYCVPQTFIDSD